MKKFLTPLLLIVTAAAILAGCAAPVATTVAPTAEPSATVADVVATETPEVAAPEVASATIINPMGPLVIPAAGIASGAVTGSVQADIQYWKTIDEATGLLAGGNAQFAVLPVTTAANLSASGVDLVLLGVHEWKVFYLIAAEGSEFTGWESLAGKTIYTPEGKGQTADVLTRYALTGAGLTPDEDVTFVYAPAQEIAALFKEGQVEYAALPEPFVTQALAGTNGSVVLDYQDYWTSVSGAEDGIPVAGLFVTRSFLEANPVATAEVARMFAASTQWANENTDAAIAASAEILPLPADVLKAALARMKFEYIPASGAKQQVLDFLTTMQDTYPEGVKAIPGDDFFGAE